MKIVIVLKHKKLLGLCEFKRLARILQILFGCSFDNKADVFRFLEEECPKFDGRFSMQVWDLSHLPGDVQGVYDDRSHTIFLSEEVYDRARGGDALALLFVVHEIAHWALITLFKIRPEFIIVEIPAVFTVTTDAELYADIFACCMMIPYSFYNGSRRRRRAFLAGNRGELHKLPLAYLSGRRYYRAVGFHKAKKRA